MPIPKPKKDEKVSIFITRCMANETMQKEYPDKGQRAAVCYAEYRKEKQKK